VYISDGPADYNISQRCKWLVTSSAPIEIVFLRLRLESNYDYVKVYEGPKRRPGAA
jgi:hypothetical protein